MYPYMLLFISHEVLFDVLEQLEASELGFRVAEKLERIDYWKHLRNAKFCLAPRGESSWTLRFYEAFFVVGLHIIFWMLLGKKKRI